MECIVCHSDQPKDAVFTGSDGLFPVCLDESECFKQYMSFIGWTNADGRLIEPHAD